MLFKPKNKALKDVALVQSARSGSRDLHVLLPQLLCNGRRAGYTVEFARSLMHYMKLLDQFQNAYFTVECLFIVALSDSAVRQSCSGKLLKALTCLEVMPLCTCARTGSSTQRRGALRLWLAFLLGVSASVTSAI